MTELRQRCERLRSLHVPGGPLVLPNAWDLPSARAVVAAGFPVVATTSAGVATALGYEDHEGAPSDEMLALAARIARGVDVPVTVDAEAGYGMDPEALVAALLEAGAAGCNLEDTDHRDETLRDPGGHADWLRSVREAATAAGYPLVINARVDSFLTGYDGSPQAGHVPAALERARAYLAAGADCVYPIVLAEPGAIATFVEGAGGPVNILAYPQAPSIGELRQLGVARISFGGLVFRSAMDSLNQHLASIRWEAAEPDTEP
ncbi:MAG: isocitrate lyase/phosphoenolpyruvate mutase family protein [Actinobacteria bacterium]|nr:isocitrate lyase/phosphoenolpyruvate mutase family protein [Actinomycetota bacterium]